MPPILPQELLDLCIDELHDDIPTLKAVSLISRAAAQRYIFRKIVLILRKTSSKDLNPCQKLAETLSCSTRLASFVKDLRIVEDGAGWKETSESLSTILRLVAPNRISITAGVLVDWEQLPGTLQASLQKTLKTPGLEFASLSAFKITPLPQFHPSHLFSTTLKSLLLCYGDGNSDGRLLSSIISPLQLRSLAIKTWSGFSGSVAWALSSPTLDFSRLETLSLYRMGMADIFGLMNAIRDRSALKDLNIWFRPDEDYVSFVAALPNLHSVCFTFAGFFSPQKVFSVMHDCTMNADLAKIRFYIDGRKRVTDSLWVNIARIVASKWKITEIHLCGGNSPSLEDIHTAVAHIDTHGRLSVKASAYPDFEEFHAHNFSTE